MQIQSGQTVSLRDINCSVFWWWLQPDGQTNWGSALMIILNGTKVKENVTNSKFTVYKAYMIHVGKMVIMGKSRGVKLVSNYSFSFVYLHCIQGIVKALILNSLVTVLSCV
jgi:hypothetical protein